MASLSFLDAMLICTSQHFRMDSQHVIKVADFGLTEEIYYGKNCHQNNQAPALLPLKWMAPECSTQGDFSEKSDVVGICCYI